MKKLGILTCTWRRHALTRLFLYWTMTVAKAMETDDLHVLPLAVGSEGDVSRNMAEDAGWLYLEHENQPLSRKFRAGMQELLRLGADAVLVIGSDSFATLELVDGVSRLVLDDRVDLAGLSDYTFLGAGPRALHWLGYLPETGRVGESMGSCRVYSRRLLELVKGDLWPEDRENGLDGAAYARIKACASFFDVKIDTRPQVAFRGRCVDVKQPGVEQICQFESYIPSATEIPARIVTSMFPSALVAAWNLDPMPDFLTRRDFNRNTDTPPRIGLAMIAKNSELSIERAIRDAAPVIDDAVVVVDGSSTDGTLDVAQRLGAAVHERPWQGFASARNFAHDISRAEWQLVLDADETLDPGDLLDAVAQAEKDDADAVMATVALTSQSGHVVPTLQPRVLRRGRFRWWGFRHNDLIGIKKTVQSTAIVRQSYVGVLEGKAKAAIVDLLRMWEAPDEPGISPEAVKAHAAFHLARSYVALGDWPNARTWAVRCREIAKTLPEKKYHSVVAIEGWAILLLEGFQAADWFVTDALREEPDLADLHFLAISIHAPLCWMYALNPPPHLVTQPQHCLPFMPMFQQAMAAIGIVTDVRYVDDAGPTA